MLISITEPAENLHLGIYKIGEGREEEKRGARELLKAMLGCEVEIGHNPNGKPVIPGFNISISHTKGYVAVLLSAVFKVGIDIEYHSDRIQKIARRFLRPDEIYSQSIDLLTVWCVKETLYKLRSEEHLTYQDMLVNVEELQVSDLKANNNLKYKVSNYGDFLLTMAWEL